MKRYSALIILLCTAALMIAPVAAVTADFTYSTDASNPMTLHFTDASSGAGNWFWTFDDGGATSTDRNPSHTFSAEGEYHVSLAASDSNYAGENTTMKWITVTRSGVTEDNTGSSANAGSGTGSSGTTSGGSSGESASGGVSGGGPISIGSISIPNPLDLIREYLEFIKKLVSPASWK
jgi:PKD repeat protein